MAASDGFVPFSGIDEMVVWSDGTGSPLILTVPVVKGQMSWTIANPTKAEMRPRDMHYSTPTLRKVGDGNVTGSGKIYCTSFLGSADETPYGVLTNAVSWVTVGAGDGAMVKMVVTLNASGAGGATQTITFAYCHFSNVAVALEDGLYVISFDFTDLENKPTIA